MPSSKVLEAIAVTAELCGRVFSPAAAMMFAADLEGFPEPAVLAALTRCRKEVKGFLTIADVVSRIDDGRPGVEQAWAMIPQDEQASAAWTEEMAAAWGIAAPLLEGGGGRIAARMAFKEAYEKLVAESRERKLPAKWTPSLGADKYGRLTAMTEAVRLNRITVDHAVLALGDEVGEALVRQLGVQDHPLLAAPSQEGRAKVQALLADLRNPTLSKE